MSRDEPSKRAHVTLPPAVPSADYFTVAEQDISRIESMLTVVGGKSCTRALSASGGHAAGS
jgi:predicted amidohydrolase YtcJ